MVLKMYISFGRVNLEVYIQEGLEIIEVSTDGD